MCHVLQYKQYSIALLCQASTLAPVITIPTDLVQATDHLL